MQARLARASTAAASTVFLPLAAEIEMKVFTIFSESSEAGADLAFILTLTIVPPSGTGTLTITLPTSRWAEDKARLSEGLIDTGTKGQRQEVTQAKGNGKGNGCHGLARQLYSRLQALCCSTLLEISASCGFFCLFHGPKGFRVRPEQGLSQP